MSLSFSKMISTLIENVIQRRIQNDSNADVAIAVDQDQNVGIARDQMVQISEHGLQLMTQFEGLALEAYPDSAGVWTIGFGTTLFPHGQKVQQGDRCTIEQAKAYMQHDLKRFEQAVIQSVKVPLNQHQFDALVCLSYNIGTGAFRNSTLLKRLNTGDFQAASDQFDVWIKAGGQTVQGLINRRAVEKALFLRK